MDKDFLKKAISQQLQAINEQMEVILEHEKKIPRIELDIIVAYTREFYEYLRQLEKENSGIKGETVPSDEKRGSSPGPEPELHSESPKPQPTAHKETQKPEAPAEQPETAEVPPVEIQADLPQPPPKQDITKQEDEPSKNLSIKDDPEVTIEPSGSVKFPAKKEEEKPVPEPQPKKPAPAIDKLSQAGETLAEKLIKEDKPRLADKIQQKKISSLKKAIGINEKFLFINELFKGRMGEYNKAIDTLDEQTSLGACNTVINDLAASYDWDKKSDPYAKLQSLVVQKFEE